MKPLARGTPSNSNGSLTIREMGAEAGVSTPTVSQAFPGPDVIVYEIAHCAK
jgi:hypothetical protein